MAADPYRRYCILPLSGPDAPSEAVAVGGWDDMMSFLPQTVAREERERKLADAQARHRLRVAADSARLDERERDAETAKDSADAIVADAVNRFAADVAALGRRMDAIERASSSFGTKSPKLTAPSTAWRPSTRRARSGTARSLRRAALTRRRSPLRTSYRRAEVRRCLGASRKFTGQPSPWARCRPTARRTAICTNRPHVSAGRRQASRSQGFTISKQIRGFLQHFPPNLNRGE
jgi:hypothetical protein